jgi:succinyl-diaminopimelate desuccinylase
MTSVKTHFKISRAGSSLRLIARNNAQPNRAATMDHPAISPATCALEFPAAANSKQFGMPANINDLTAQRDLAHGCIAILNPLHSTLYLQRHTLSVEFSSARMTKTEKLLSDLVALPSVNPAFLPENHGRAGEQRVADYLAAVAVASGLDVAFQTVLSSRANLIARLSPPGKISQRVLLAPHLDTVNADDFLPRIRNGRLHGRGACDTKGSVASMLSALCDVAMSGARPRETEIIFAGLIDEENAQAGSRALAASGLKADLAIIGEPTRLQVVTAHKGDVWLRLETRGKAAHGSRPELGRNAVQMMAQVVNTLETDYAAKLRKRSHPLLGPATINVGTIQGGTQPNIVPDRCTISIDRRTLPGETEAGVRREIGTFLAKRKLKVSFANEKLAPCLPMETSADAPLVRRFLRAARQRKPMGVHFFCDAAIFAAAGIPSVVFGPGDIAQAHTADEWISLPSLERAHRILVNYLRSLP